MRQMKRAVIALTFAAALASTPARAHEGHAHKVMGTVCAVQPARLDVKTTDGKPATLELTDKTKVVRGSAALEASDIRPGHRVVVTATETKGKDGKTSMVASRVHVGVAGEPCAPAPAPGPAAETPRVP